MSREKVFNRDIVKLREFVPTGNTDDEFWGKFVFHAPSSFQPQINFRQGRPKGSSVFACCVIKCRSSGLMTIKGTNGRLIRNVTIFRFICLAAQDLQSGSLST